MNGGERKLSVMLADDHPIVLGGLATLLRANRFEVVSASANGLDALNALRNIEPDLAVLDICMPGLTGLQVLQHVEDEGLRTRIVFLTASATDEQILKAVTHGAWAIMLKDAAADSLVNCLENVAMGKRWLPPELVSPALSREAERRTESEHFDTVLTAREREISILVADGLSNKEIARRTNISEGTVKIHLHNAYQKLGLSNRTSLAGVARRGSGSKR